MDRAPLPPHERPWRHPSELGPPEHEPTTPGGRALIATSATLTLLLIGLLAVTMTPGRSDQPEATGSSTSGLRTPARPPAEEPRLPVVTPIGDDGWAVTTMGAVAGHSGRLSARLPSGDIVAVEIVTTDREAGLTVVSLPPSAKTEGYELASSAPAPSDTVVVQGRPPRVVTMVEVASLDVDEATPVLDDDGDLIGLCTADADGIEVRVVATMPGDPSVTTTIRRANVTVTTVAGTVPETTPPPVTVATPSTPPAPTVPAGSTPGTVVTGASTSAPG